MIVGALPSDPKQVKGEIERLAEKPWCRRQNSKSRRSVINDQHSVFVRKVFSCLPFEVEGRKLMADRYCSSTLPPSHGRLMSRPYRQDVRQYISHNNPSIRSVSFWSSMNFALPWKVTVPIFNVICGFS